jgi:hypothetical protein
MAHHHSWRANFTFLSNLESPYFCLIRKESFVRCDLGCGNFWRTTGSRSDRWRQTGARGSWRGRPAAFGTSSPPTSAPPTRISRILATPLLQLNYDPAGGGGREREGAGGGGQQHLGPAHHQPARCLPGSAHAYNINMDFMQHLGPAHHQPARCLPGSAGYQRHHSYKLKGHSYEKVCEIIALSYSLGLK